jgi:hypothetical protein
VPFWSAAPGRAVLAGAALGTAPALAALGPRLVHGAGWPVAPGTALDQLLPWAAGVITATRSPFAAPALALPALVLAAGLRTARARLIALGAAALVAAVAAAVVTPGDTVPAGSRGRRGAGRGGRGLVAWAFGRHSAVPWLAAPLAAALVSAVDAARAAANLQDRAGALCGAAVAAALLAACTGGRRPTPGRPGPPPRNAPRLQHPPMPRLVPRSPTARVLVAITLGALLGAAVPAAGTALKPLADTFVNLVKLVVGPVVFCTIVLGIAGMRDLRAAGRVGLKALVYFEVVTTAALALGLLVANVTRPGAGLDPSRLPRPDVSRYTGAAQEGGVAGILAHVVPASAVDAFARGDVLQIVFVSILFGVGLAAMGERGDGLARGLGRVQELVFRVVAIVMAFAPVGAFAAMAYTVGTFGCARWCRSPASCSTSTARCSPSCSACSGWWPGGGASRSSRCCATSAASCCSCSARPAARRRCRGWWSGWRPSGAGARSWGWWCRPATRSTSTARAST